jgi:hypothetical protein
VSHATTSSKWTFSNLFISPYSRVRCDKAQGYEIVDIDRNVWESFYVVGWDFEDRYRLLTTVVKENCGQEYLHVPKDFVLVIVADTFRFNIPEEIDHSFHRVRDIYC